MLEDPIAFGEDPFLEKLLDYLKKKIPLLRSFPASNDLPFSSFLIVSPSEIRPDRNEASIQARRGIGPCAGLHYSTESRIVQREGKKLKSNTLPPPSTIVVLKLQARK